MEGMGKNKKKILVFFEGRDSLGGGLDNVEKTFRNWKNHLKKQINQIIRN